MTSVISSPPVGDKKELLRLADVALGQDWGSAQRSAHLGRGLAAYRLGDWKVALESCAKSRELATQRYGVNWKVRPQPEGVIAANLLVEAMAQHHLGKSVEAKAAYDDAVERIKKGFPDADIAIVGVGENWLDWVHCELLRHEAEALLQIPKPKERESTTTSQQPATAG
jgi:hypothetical protein